MSAALWVAQALLAEFFLFARVAKLVMALDRRRSAGASARRKPGSRRGHDLIRG
jgi:hypothetical protein